MFKSNLAKGLGALLALAIVVAIALLVIPGGGSKKVVAEFPRTVSLYTGSDVKILGVKVGTVDDVRPDGDKVVVTMSYDEKYDVPADAKAVLVSPSIVGDRYVQLTPAYKSGAVMADNTRLGLKRTSVPLELDEIYGSLNDLSIALGPDEANKANGSDEGALTRLLDSTSRNFGGQGTQFNKTITDVARLTKTLSDNKDELFGAAREIETFINTLAENDTTVRQFNDSLASAADLLAGERKDLAAALRNLSVALTDVKGFVSDNKTLLSSNIKDLNTVAKVLVKRRDALNGILKDAPLALNNLGLAYNPKIGVLNTRANLGEALNQLEADPGTLICSYVPVATRDVCLSSVGALNLGRAGALKRTSTSDDPNKYVDPTLAGLVEARR